MSGAVGHHGLLLAASASVALSGYWETNANVSLAESDRLLRQGSGGWDTARSVGGQTTGKWYAEAFSVFKTNIYDDAFGLCNAAYSTFNDFSGESANAWVLQASDNVSGARFRTAGAYSGTAITAIPVNGYFRVAVDYDAGKAWFGNPTEWYGGGDPAAGTTPTLTFTPNTQLYLVGSVSSGLLRICTKENEQTGTRPTGFEAWGGPGGDSALPRYRYWRIFITANNGDASFTSVAEMKLKIGGIDMTTGGTAAASTAYFGDNGSRAFDENTTAGATWVTNSGAHLNSWVRYDFGAGKEKAITELGLWAEPGNTNRAPKDFVVEASNDASTWATMSTVTNSTGWSGGVEKTFSIP